MEMEGLSCVHQTEVELSHSNSFQSQTQHPRHHTGREVTNQNHTVKGKRKEKTVLVMMM